MCIPASLYTARGLFGAKPGRNRSAAALAPASFRKSRREIFFVIRYSFHPV